MNVGHYQKRVGIRLRKLKKEQKGLNALTEPVIANFQNYFGIALRVNTGGTVQPMADAIWLASCMLPAMRNRIIMIYVRSHPQVGANTNGDRFNNTNLFQHGTALPNDVIAHVKPIYTDLIKHEEPKKCLHGRTQNQNESFN